MSNIKTCIYPIFFSSIGFIIYRSYRYNQDILVKKHGILAKNQQTVDKFNDPDYNPFIPHRPN